MSQVIDNIMAYIQGYLDEAPDDEARDDVRDEVIRRLQVDAGNALLARISKRVHDVFPTAYTLRATGEWNEDMLLRLYPKELLDADGASLASADEPTDEWVSVFELDEMDDDLVELAESDDAYEGETEITLR